MASVAPRFLFLGDYHPEYGLPTYGALQRSACLLEALGELGLCDVALLVRNAEEAQPCEADLDIMRQRLCLAAVIRCSEDDWQPDPPAVCPSPVWPRKVRALLEYANAYTCEFRCHAGAAEEMRRLVASGAYSAVVCRYLVPAVMVGLGRCTPHVPVIVDMDDDPYEKRLTALNTTQRGPKQRMLDAIGLRHLRRVVASHLDRVSHVWLAKPADSRRYRHVRATRSVLPNIPIWQAIPACASLPSHESRTVLFVGTLNYAPNRHGLIRFLREAWPRVLAQVPDAMVVVAGTTHPSAVAELEGCPRVTLAGYVPDLSEVYRQAAFTVCPVFQGGGTNIKVLESLAYGRTCVVPGRVSDAFPELQVAGVLASSRSMEGMAAWCVRLLQQPELRETMGQRGLAVVRRTHSQAVFTSRVREDVQSFMASCLE